MFVKSLILTVWMAGVSLALPRSRRDSTPTDFELPANATAILDQPLQTGFACDQRVYGFYADVDNRCQVFHVCYPFVDVDLLIKVRMFSFICGPGLVFDQEKLVCDFPANSLPCEFAPNFYNINNYFGRVDLTFREQPVPEVPTNRDFQVQTFAEFSRNLQ